MLNKLRADLNNRLLALTVARRSMRRNLIQTVLIILIIAIPVAPATLALNYFESTTPTTSEKLELALGETAAKMNAQIAVADEQLADIAKNDLYQLPDASTIIQWSTRVEPLVFEHEKLRDPRDLDIVDGEWLTEYSDFVEVKTEAGQGVFNLVEGETWNPAFEGRYTLTSGSAPRKASEVLVTMAALERLGLKVGDELTLSVSGDKRKIVGTMQAATLTNKISTIFAPTASITGIKPEDALSATEFYLVSKEPVTWTQVVELNRHGIGVYSRAVVLDPPSEDKIPLVATGYQDSMWDNAQGGLLVAIYSIAIFGPIVLVPVAILAGSAFSFGARRQARTLAVLSSLGARRKYLHFMTVANGIWLGLLGGLFGLTLGIIASAVILPIVADGSRSIIPGFHVPWLALALTLAGASVIGAAVSLVPAMTAAKVDVLSTLRGVRAQARVRRATGIAGVMVAATGIAGMITGSGMLQAYRDQLTKDPLSYNSTKMTLLSMAPVIGAVVLIIGLLMSSGWLLVAVRAVFKRGSVVASYASNDLLYNRKRYQPVIASVIATAFLASTLLGTVFSLMKHQADSYQARLPHNQILIDPSGSMGDWSSGEATGTKPIEHYQQLVAESTDKLGRSLKIASNVGEVRSSAVISKHLPLGTLGYAVDNASAIPEYGAEGDMPFLQLNDNYRCPWDPQSPRFAEVNALDLNNLIDLKKREKIDSDPRYRGCDALTYGLENILVGDGDDLSALIGKDAPSAAKAALESGKAVALNPGFVVDGQVGIDWYPSGTGYIFSQLAWIGAEDSNHVEYEKVINNPLKTKKLDSVLVDALNPDLAIMISQATADRLGISHDSAIMVVNYASALTVAQTDELNANQLAYQIDQGYGTDPNLVAWMILLFAGLFVIAATSIALGLAQIESRADQSTLGSIGAPRSFRARVLGLQAFTLTGLGMVLGSAAGFYLAWTLMNLNQSATETPMFQVAWPQSVLLVAGIPLIAASIFWIGTSKRSAYRLRLAVD